MNNLSISIRILADVIIAVCIFIAPFWTTAGLAIVCTFFFPRYYELVIFAIIVDVLYVSAWDGYLPAPTVLSSVAIYAGVYFLKPRVRVWF